MLRGFLFLGLFLSVSICSIAFMISGGWLASLFFLHHCVIVSPIGLALCIGILLFRKLRMCSFVS